MSSRTATLDELKYIEESISNISVATLQNIVLKMLDTFVTTIDAQYRSYQYLLRMVNEKVHKCKIIDLRFYLFKTITV